MNFTLPKQMKAVQMIGHGGAEMLQHRDDLPLPNLSSSDVLIQVSAAGVNNTDINTRIGWYSKNDGSSEDASWGGNQLNLPLTQGADVCGIIVAVGEEVNSKRIGERVIVEPCLTRANAKPLESTWYFGSECNGGFAEYTVVDTQHAYHVNSTMTDIELASFPCSYSTAENMLTRASVTNKDVVLISGASGGVGSAAVQLAKARGATVIAITSESKKQQLLKLGADRTINRNESLVESLGDNSVSVVIDLVAGEQWPQFLQCLKPKGRYAVSGAIGGALVELDVRTLYLKDLSFFGCTVIEPEVFPNLVKRIENGDIKPLVAKIFPLKDIAQAQEHFSQKTHVGKIVLAIK